MLLQFYDSMRAEQFRPSNLAHVDERAWNPIASKQIVIFYNTSSQQSW